MRSASGLLDYNIIYPHQPVYHGTGSALSSAVVSIIIIIFVLLDGENVNSLRLAPQQFADTAMPEKRGSPCIYSVACSGSPPHE